MSTPVNNSPISLVSAVVNRLTAALPELSVEFYPDNPAQYQLNHPIGAVLVRYPGSKYSKSLDTELPVLARTLSLEISLVCRSLNGEGGIYDWLEAVRLSLTGYVVPAFEPLTPVSDSFVAEDSGEWHWFFDFVTNTTALPDYPDENLTVLKHISLHDTLYRTEIKRLANGNTLVTTEKD